MAVLTLQNIDRLGAAPTYAAATGGGDSFPNDERTLVHIKNGGGAISLSVQTQLTVDGKPVADDSINVPAGGERMVGPFPAPIYNDANGRVNLAYSGVTSVTVGVFRLT